MMDGGTSIVGHGDHRWQNGRARVEAARAAEGNPLAGRAGAKRRRMPRVASALVPTPVLEASAVVIDEAVAELDAIAPAEVEQHPP